jgi:intracellular multiplication protein IcmO
MQKQSVGLGGGGHDKGRLERLQQDIKTKEQQFKKYKFLMPVFAKKMASDIIKLKNNLLKEANQGNEKIGSGFTALTSPLKEDEVDLDSYQNFLLGTDESLNPVLINNTNQHMGLFGGSGSGKSVFLFNIMRQLLESGGGATFIDGKGDSNMFFDFISWAKQFDRLDDLYILDFSQVESHLKDEDGNIQYPTTNTFNLFEALSMDEACGILKGMLFPPGEKEDFFKSQASGVFDNIVLLLKYQKSVGERVTLDTYAEAIDLRAQLVQAIPSSPEDPLKPDMEWVLHNELSGFEGFWIPKAFGAEEDGKSYANKILTPLKRYGFRIFSPGESYVKEEAVSEQLQMQIGGYAATALTKVASLSNSYPHIFNSLTSDLNFTDVISEGKLVYVRIPNMKIPFMSKNIGSIIINSFMNAVGDSLGGSLGREAKSHTSLFSSERLRAVPTHLLILDELAAFVGDAKDPLQALLSQARSVNISCIVSSQEEGQLERGATQDGFVNSLKSNTMTKVFLKISDPATLKASKEIIDTTQKEMGDDGEVKSKQEESEIISYLQKVKDGLGFIQSGSSGKFLTAFHEVDKKNVIRGVPPLNK